MLHQAYHYGRSFLLLWLFLIPAMALQAQLTSYEGINYQAIIRNADGQVLSGQAVTLRITIYQKGKLGDGYVERHQTSTNLMGLVVLKVGDGIPEQNHIDSVKWEEATSAPFYMKIELDENGGQSYRSMGESELLSVPYAFFAREAGRALNDQDTSDQNEIQSLVYDSLANTLIITSHSQAIINLGHYLDNTDVQELTFLNDTLYISQLNGPAKGVYLGIFDLRNDLTALEAKVRADSIVLSNNIRSDSTDLANKIVADSVVLTAKMRADSNALRVLINTNSTDITNLQADKLDWSDTTGMLQPYIERGDTSAMLTPYIERGDTANMLNPYVARGDTSGMLTPYVERGDTASMLTPYVERGDTSSMLLPYVERGDTANMLNPYVERGDTASMLTPYIERGDTAAMLANYLQSGDTASLSTRIDTKVNFTDTAGMLLPYVERGDTAGMLTPYIQRGDTAAMLADYLNSGDTASLSNRIDSKVNISDTAGMLTPYIERGDTAAMLSNYLNSADTASLSNRIDTKVNISDTNAMLTPYIERGDTAAMLADYLNSGDTASLSSRIDSKVNISDTNAMLTPYVERGDTAAMLANYLNSADTASLSNRIDTKVNISDTNAMLTPYIERGDTAAMLANYLNSGDTASLSSRIDSKVNISDTNAMLTPYVERGDTAAMLANYLNSGDTASLSNRIDTKVNISDTASMLSTYLESGDTASLSARIDVLDAGAYKDSSATNEVVDSVYLSGNDLIVVEANGSIRDTTSLAAFNGSSNLADSMQAIRSDLADTATVLRGLITTNATDISNLSTKQSADSLSLATSINTNSTDISNLSTKQSTDSLSLATSINTNATDISAVNTKLSNDSLTLANKILSDSTALAGQITTLDAKVDAGAFKDSSATNELQNLSINGANDSLLISNGAGVRLSDIQVADTLPIIQDVTRARYVDVNNTGQVEIGVDDTTEYTFYEDRIETRKASVFIGNGAGQNDPGTYEDSVANVGVGYHALQNNNGNSGSVAIGAEALATNGLVGPDNTAVGNQAMKHNFNGANNVAVGKSALKFSTNPSGNVALGALSLSSATTGNGNTAIGFNAGSGLTSGGNNVFIGTGSGISGSFSDRLYINNGSSTTPLIWGDFANDSVKVFGTFGIRNSYFFPSSDGNNNEVLATDGLGNLTFKPLSALSDTLDIIKLNDTNYIQIVSGAAGIGLNNAVPAYVFKTGKIEMSQSGGSFYLGSDLTGLNDDLSDNVNIGIGRQALQENVTGEGNTAVGERSFQNLKNNDNNTGLGRNAGVDIISGSNNTFIGQNAGGQIIGGSNNTFLGMDAGSGILLNHQSTSGAVKIGYQAGTLDSTDNKLFIDNSSTNTPLIWGDFANDSLTVFGVLSVDSAKDGTGYSFPGKDGSSGDFLTTDGNGNLSFTSLGTTNLTGVLAAGNDAGQDTILNLSQIQVGTGGYGGVEEYGVHSNLNNASAIGKKAVFGNTGASTAFSIGVEGRSDSAGTGLNYGVYGQATGGGGIARGVVGVQLGTGTLNNAGVYGISLANGGPSIALYGRAVSANVDTNYGLWLRAENGINNYAAYLQSGNLYVADTLILPNNAVNGYVLTSDADGKAGWAPIPTVDLGDTTQIADSDGDTKVLTDDGSDDDRITFEMNGKAFFQMDSARIEILNSGGSVFLGEGAGQNDDYSTNRNVLIGFDAGAANSTGTDNVAVGYQSQLNNTGSSNTSVGALSLEQNTSGIQNTAMGYSALGANTTGFNNAAFGFQAADLITTAQQNTAIGSSSLKSNVSGNSNTAIGYNSLANSTAGFNTAIGANSALSNTTGQNNVALGYNSARLNQTGSHNTALGYEAMRASTSQNDNVAIGAFALEDNTASGNGNNVAIGVQSLQNTTSSSDNISIGRGAMRNATGNQNVALGTNAGDVAGSGNIFLGYQAGQTESGSNKLYIDNGNATTPLIWGDFSADSLTFNGKLFLDSAKDGSGYAFTGLRGSSGQFLTTDGSGNTYWSSAAAVSLGDTTQIADGDADTYIKTEASADEDIIRFATNGSEHMTINSNGTLQMGDSATTGTFADSKYRMVINEKAGTAFERSAKIENHYTGSDFKTGLDILLDKDGTGGHVGLYTLLQAGNLTSTQYGHSADMYTVGTQKGYNFFSNIRSQSATDTTYSYYSLHSATLGTNYGIYTEGEDFNHFDGRVGIGIVVPSHFLDIDVATDTLAGFYLDASAFSSGAVVGHIVENSGGSGTLQSTAGEFNSYGAGLSSYGVAGFAQNASGGNVGVDGAAVSSGSAEAYGVSGTALGGGVTNFGVYGTASGGTTNWSGYFDAGNVYIEDTIYYNEGNVAAGSVLTSDAMGRLTLVAPTAVNLGDTTQLADLDNDTRILTDKNGADEDQIRFEIKGTEYYRFDSTRIHFTQTNGENTVIGNDAGKAMDYTAALSNTLFGTLSGQSITNGDRNSGFGRGSLALLTTGSQNTAVGSGALQKVVTSGDNTAVGYSALNSNTGFGNVAVGSNALVNNTSGIINVAVGTNSMFNNTTGRDNVAIGYQALNANTTADSSVAVGRGALQSGTTVGGNVGIGYDAGKSNTTGAKNTLVGTQAGGSSTSGSGNVFLGYQSGQSENGSNLLYIENSSSTTPLVWGDFAEDSLVINGKLFLDSALNGSGYALPGLRGTAGQYMTTDGAGNAYWSTIIDTLVCPAGFDKVNDSYCIHSAEQTAVTWFTATQTCASNGYELSTYADWYSAAAILTLTDEADDWEWMSNISQNNMMVAGNGDIKNRTFKDPNTDTAPYRCVYRKQ